MVLFLEIPCRNSNIAGSWQVFLNIRILLIIIILPTMFFRLILVTFINGFYYVSGIYLLGRVLKWPTLMHITVVDSFEPATNSFIENTCRESNGKVSILTAFLMSMYNTGFDYEAFSHWFSWSNRRLRTSLCWWQPWFFFKNFQNVLMMIEGCFRV